MTQVHLQPRTMAYYGYQYKQQCYVPGGLKHPTPVFMQCHNPSAVRCASCTPCAARGAKLCAVRKALHSSPTCSSPCSPRCVETQVVEGHSSSCRPRSPEPCVAAFPQGREQLCVSHCAQPGLAGCPQVCAPAHLYQHTACPYSYQWSNSYHYNCGQQ